MEIGQRILELRLKLGMTQEELAHKMGYKSKSTINKIEMGKVDVTQTNVMRFAQVLGTTPAVLMGWDEETYTKLLKSAEINIRNQKVNKFISKMDDSTFQKWIEIGEMLVK